MKTTTEILCETRAALPALSASRDRKNEALERIAARLLSECDAILRANRIDIEAAAEKYGPVMIDRLTLTAERIRGMAEVYR
mgnify:CR=1 FL=1